MYEHTRDRNVAPKYIRNVWWMIFMHATNMCEWLNSNSSHKRSHANRLELIATKLRDAMSSCLSRLKLLKYLYWRATAYTRHSIKHSMVDILYGFWRKPHRLFLIFSIKPNNAAVISSHDLRRSLWLNHQSESENYSANAYIDKQMQAKCQRTKDAQRFHTSCGCCPEHAIFSYFTRSHRK